MKSWIHSGLWVLVVGLSVGMNAKEVEKKAKIEIKKAREISRKPLPGTLFQVLAQTETPADQQLNQIMTLSVELVSHTKETAGAREKWKLTTFDAKMPAHKHGMVVKSVVETKEAGKWSIAPVKLHMRGHWVLEFTFENGTQTQVITQDLHVP